MMGRLLKNNLIVKIIAVFIALLLWIYVAGDTLQRAAIPEVARPYRGVSLSWMNLGGDLAIMEIPGSVDIILHGRRDILDGIAPQTLRIYVDLSRLAEGEHLLAPKAELPRGVRIVSFSPQQVRVRLERVESMQKPIYLEILGSPAEGYVAEEPTITPNSVIIRGPRSVLDNVDHMRATISIDGADSDRIQMVSVYAYNSLGQVMEGLDINPVTAEVSLPISVPQKSVPVRVPLLGELPAGYQILQVQTEPRTVTIQGRDSVLAAVTELLTEPADITELTENAAFELDLVIPPDITVTHQGSVRVVIAVQREETEQQ